MITINSTQGKHSHMYTTAHMANTIIELSFQQDNYINANKLNRIIYLVNIEYLKETNGEELLNERFITGRYGPYLESINQYYAPLKNNPITKYIKNVNNDYYKINTENNKILHKIVLLTWAKTINYTWQELSIITRKENSAWDKAYQNNKETINTHDMITDNTINY